MKYKKKLGEKLIEAGLITRDQLQKALEYQSKHGKRIGSVLVELGFITEKQLLSFLSKESGIPAMVLTEKSIDPEVLKFVPSTMAVRYNMIPVKFMEKNGRKTIVVAVSDPMNIEILDDLRFMLGMEITPVIASDMAIFNAIEHFYFGRKKDFDLKIIEPVEEGSKITGDELYGFSSINRRIDRIERSLKYMGELLCKKGIISEEEYGSMLEKLYIEE